MNKILVTTAFVCLLVISTVHARDNSGITFQYDQYGQQKGYSVNPGAGMSFQYDNRGRQQGYNIDSGAGIQFQYDNRGRQQGYTVDPYYQDNRYRR